MVLIKELKGLLPQLTNAKFLAYLLEPVLLWGLLSGIIAWMLSLWVLKHRQAQLCSLIMLALSAFCVFPVMHYRKKAAPLSAPSKELRDRQNERRQQTQWVYYAMGSLAVLGIFLTGEGKGKAGTITAIGITAGGIATVIFSLWLHEKEVSVFHEDARRMQRAALPQTMDKTLLPQPYPAGIFYAVTGKSKFYSGFTDGRIGTFMPLASAPSAAAGRRCA